MTASGAVAIEASWFQSTARQRVDGLLDAGSFVEFVGPAERVQSPHLQLFDLPAAFDDGIVVGRGRLRGRDVLIAAQEGQFMGGTFGEVSGAKMVGLLRAARDDSSLPRTVLLLLDSGGVRLQEANAGELGVAEVMRAIAEVRRQGVAVVAVVGGRSGAFGGAGLTAAMCSRIVVSEQGRIGVTGPEVIETNKGVEEFDSSDKALVWRTVGGKTRRLTGAADAFAEDTMAGFRKAIEKVLESTPAFDAATLGAEHQRLSARFRRLKSCEDAPEIWKSLGINDSAAVKDMRTEEIVRLADSLAEANHEAR